MAQDTVPSFKTSLTPPFTVIASKTSAQNTTQPYTYDQAGFSYDQAGWQYGGVYGENQILSPVFFNDSAKLVTPTINSIIDMGTHPPIPPGPNNQAVIGPGFWLYVGQ